MAAFRDTQPSRFRLVRTGGVFALLGGMLYLFSMLSHPHGILRAAVPLSVLCLIVGIVGLHGLLWDREGRLGLLGFVCVGIGLLLGLIGMTGSAVGILNPNPLARIINTGEHAGLVFIGAGMLLWGVLTLRLNALGRWSVLPLILGLLGISGIVLVIPALFSILEDSIVPEVFAVVWMLLGYALLTVPHKPPLGVGPGAQA